jgi:TRAP-type mannitol/chloroaromatic compound transport system permease large subunit
MGAFGALVLALAKRSLTGKELLHLILDSTESCAGIMFLLVSAQTYSRMLAMTGLVSWVSKGVLG